jgi:hypothetical protein
MNDDDLTAAVELLVEEDINDPFKNWAMAVAWWRRNICDTMSLVEVRDIVEGALLLSVRGNMNLYQNQFKV